MAVYFIEGAKLIKIGYTTQDTVAAVRRRRSSMQTCSPVELTIRGWVIGGEELEEWLHRELAEWHAQGEWFREEGGVAKLLAWLATEPNAIVGELLKQHRWRENDGVARKYQQAHKWKRDRVPKAPSVLDVYGAWDPEKAEALRSLGSKLAKGNFRAKK